MRRIVKQHEPAELIAHRMNQVGADFDNAPKEPMRKALHAEQEGLCAYCMRQIEATVGAMKIEHHTPQTVDASRALDWSNLLGVCMGGEGQPPARHTCDTRKGDATLALNPTHERVERQVRYATDGTIIAADPHQQHELDEVLGLNTPHTRDARKATLDAFLAAMRHRKAQGTWTADDYEALLESFRMTRLKRVRGYIGIVEWNVREKRRKAR